MLSILSIIWVWFDLSFEFSKFFDNLIAFYTSISLIYSSIFPFFRIFYLFLLLGYGCFPYSNLFVFTVPGLNCTFLYVSLFLAKFFYLFWVLIKDSMVYSQQMCIFYLSSFNILSFFYGFGLPRNTFVSRFYLFRSIRRWKIHSIPFLNLPLYLYLVVRILYLILFLFLTWLSILSLSVH